MLLAAQKLDVVRIEYNHLKIYYIDLLYHIDVVRNNSWRWQKMTLLIGFYYYKEAWCGEKWLKLLEPQISVF